MRQGSLIKVLKSNGPRTHPFVTPILISSRYSASDSVDQHNLGVFLSRKVFSDS